MTTFRTNLIGWTIGALGGAVLGALAALYLAETSVSQPTGIPNAAADKPLYWVAPMDPAYKRDKPGKSPMGMDLIPVYADAGEGNDAGPGTVRISAEVVNNLGVREAEVTRAPLHTSIRTVGYVQYDEDRLVHIHPRVEGWVEKLFVKAAGDPVEKGQALYELYSPELVNAQEELLLALNRESQVLIRAAKERLVALQLPEDFIRNLIKTRQVSQTVTFHAPQTGFLDNLNIREGFFVKPGTTLMSIGVLDEVWVEAEVFERQVALVEVGMPVTMTLDYQPGREWQGRVDYIYPSLNEKTRTLRVRLKFANVDTALRPNMFAQVVLHPTDGVETLIVPREAVIRTGHQQRVVLALGEGRFKSVAVTVGRMDETHAEILNGVKVGEFVVTSAQFLLDSESSKTSDFQRMRPVEEDESMEEAKSVSAWTAAKILGLMPEHRMVSVSHEAIADWNWPAMTMDFVIADDVEFESLQKDQALNIEITQLPNGKNVISKIHIKTAEQLATPSTQEHGHD